MTRTLGICLLTLTLLGIPAVTAANHSPNAADEQLGVSNGAQYAMFVPAAWNGRLVLWAHGFVDPAAPIVLPDAQPPDVAPWLIELRESLLAAPEGYFTATPGIASGVRWRVGGRLVASEPFTHALNQPEQVLKALHGDATAPVKISTGK